MNQQQTATPISTDSEYSSVVSVTLKFLRSHNEIMGKRQWHNAHLRAFTFRYSFDTFVKRCEYEPDTLW